MCFVEEETLWRQYIASGDMKVKEKLIKQYVPLVRHIVNRMNITPPSYMDYEDMISYGIFGLIQSIDRFDLTTGVKFGTYAYARIKGSIIDELRKTEKVPASVIKKTKMLQNSLAKLEQELGAAPGDDDLCRFLNITLYELHEMYSEVALYSTAIPFEDLIHIEDNCGDIKGPDVLAEKQETKEILAEAVNRLPQQERLVVTLYYYEDLNFKEIAEAMRLSQGRISQLHTKAILRLRGRFSRNKALLAKKDGD
jgi:RNA polymerase sigma factor for flagellar operon FliA